MVLLDAVAVKIDHHKHHYFLGLYPCIVMTWMTAFPISNHYLSQLSVPLEEIMWPDAGIKIIYAD